jgi:hypothetical protein
MTEQNHKEYTAADFERYYSGQMPESEMHALEKSALEDPFLADALEGYSYTETPAKDIAELNEKLFKKKERNKIFFLQNKMWLKVAASIILFAGIGYMIYELNSPKKFLAKNDVRQTVKNRDSNLVVQNDTIKNAVASAPKAFEVTNQETADNEKGLVQKQNITKKKTDSSPLTAYNFSLVKDKDLKPQNEIHVVEGRVPGTVVTTTENANADNKKIAVVEDTLRFKSNLKDSSFTATIAGATYKAKQRSLAKNPNQSFNMIDTAHQNLEEVVVSGYGVSTKRKDTLLKGKITGISFNDPNYGPVGGWEKFDEYLLDNVTAPIGINENRDGDKTKVVLSFEVDKKGDPKKVQIEKSLCAECDKEAIRLLQSGPKWKYVAGKKYVIDVKF